MQEWSSPVIVLNTRPYGETDGIVSVLSLEQGLFRGLVKGMISRRQISIWQTGNFVNVDWSAKLSDQLGYFKGELIRSNFAILSPCPLAFSAMLSLCAVAESGLLERQPVEYIAKSSFQYLDFVAENPTDSNKEIVPRLLRWELNFLAALGYALDISICYESDKCQSFFVSPRTGKVVTEVMAGKWKPKLFPFPSFFLNEEENGNQKDWMNGLKLSRYFLEKNVFSLINKDLPRARKNFEEKVAANIDNF